MKKITNFICLKKLTKSVALFILLTLSFVGRAQNVTVAGAVTGNGSYPDLNSAFTAINGGVQTSANITVSILASTTETASAVLNQGAWNFLLISPSGGNYTVSGDLAAPLIDLNGADLVTINGINSGGNALTISNTNTLNLSTSTIRMINDATLNNILNCTVLGSSRSAALGTITFSTATTLGNSNNNILNCNIGPAGTNLPNNGIFSLGTASFDNKNNTISNCNVYDYFTPDIASSGIFISSNNSNWNISDNRLYQTALRTYTVASTVKAIQVGSGNSYTVSGNIIGYSSSAGTGTTSMYGGIATRFVGIELSVATLTASSVQNNTVSAITLTTASNASTINGALCGINITAGNVNVSNNLIGSTSGLGSISSYPSVTGGLLVGINSSSTGTINIAGNYIASCISTGTTAAVAGNLTGINISGIATGMSVSSNTIGNTTADNFRGGTIALITAATIVHGINFVSAPSTTSVVVNANLIRNMASYGMSTTAAMRGIRAPTSSGYAITNNTITSCVTTNNNNSTTSGIVGTAGIQCDLGGSNYTVANNFISNIANTGTATTHVIVAGISTGASTGTNTFRYNRIYNLINTCPGVTATTPPVACGFFIRSGTNVLLIHNNMVSLGNGQSSNTTFMGIYGNHGSTPNPTVQIYHNTFNIEGTVTTGALSSFGVGRTDFSATAKTPLYDVKNNLITNTRSGGTGGHYAIANNFGATASATGWSANAANYNILNASSGTIGWWTSAQTFAGWKTSSASDNNSYSGATVTYVNSATDLHINMGTTPNLIESSATPIAGMTNDIDGQNRPGPSGSINGGGTLPDIGADEFDGVILDILPPVITHTFVGSGCSTSDRTLTANINDASGVPTTGSLVPRVYFNKNAGAYSSNAGVLASGTASTGVWNFTISASALGGLSNNDVVTYFITAQDAASTVNIGALPLAGFVAVDVNSVTTTPTVPYSYTVNAISAGSISLASFTTCSSQSVSIISGSSTIGSDVSRYWQVSSSSGGPYTNLISGTGLTSTAVTTGSLSTGTLYFVMSATCLANNQSTISNEATVSINPTPSSSISVNTQSVCLGSDLIFTGSTDVGTTFNWSGPGSFISTTQNPTITGIGSNGSGTYSLYTNLGSCNSATATIGVTVMGTVTVLSPASTNSATICGGGVAQMSVSAAPSNTAINLYSYATGTGATLINTSAGTNVLNSGNDDTPMASPSNIGFTFNFNGTNYTQFSASPDGWIMLGAGTAVSSFGNGVTLTTNLPKIYPYWDDLATGTNGFVRTLLTGTAPNRIFVVEWFVNIPRNTAGAANSSFQLLLYETTNAIEFRYGTMGVPVGTSSSGLTNSATIFNCITFTTNSNSASVANDNNIAVPTSGRYYIFSPGIVGYNWSPSLSLSSSSLSSVTSSAVASTVYTLTMNNNGFCPTTNTVALTVVNPVTLNVTPSSSVVCSGASATITASGANAYLWDNASTSNSIVVSPSSNTTYTVIGSATLPCPDVTETITIASGITPTLSIAGTASICSGSTSTITASGANTYSWNNSSTNNSIVVSPSVTASYTVTGYDIVGCSSNTIVSLQVSPLPNVSISGASSVCPSSAISLLASGATNYVWSTGALTASLINTPTTNTTYTVTGTDALGCSNFAIQTVSLGVNPTVSVAVSSSACVGQTINLTASGASTYSWNTGSTGAALTVTPNNITSYTVLGTSADGCTATAIQSVQVAQNPTLTFAGSTGICTGQTVNLSVSGANSYSWNTGALTNSISTTPTNNITYTVTGTDLLGCSTTTTQLVTVAASLSITIAGPSTICLGQAVTLTGNGGVTYTWDSGANSQTIAPSPTVTTTYSIIGASGTCSNSGVKTVTVNPNPSISVSGSLLVCLNVPTTLTASGATTYSWSTGVSTASTAISAPAIGVYTVTGANTFGCSQTQTVSVLGLPLPNISVAQSANTVCVSSPASFTASGANTYTWSTASNNTVISITPTVANTYTVSGTNGSGCISSSTFALATFSLPVVTIAPSSATVCSLSQASFAASGASTYTWNSSIQSPTAAFTPTTSSVYTVSGTNASGCVSTVTVGVTTNTLPILSITPPSATVCVSTVANFTASGASTYTWSGSVVSNTVAFTPTATTVYTVTGLNPAGCRTTNSISVTTNTLPVITIAPASASVCALTTSSYAPSGAVTYTWNNTSSNTLSTVSTSAVVTPTTSAIYTVTGTNAAGCVSSKTLAIGVYALPVLTITPASPTVCSLSQVSYTASGASTYTWNGTVTTATAAFNPSVSSIYTITGTSVNNCVSTTTVGVVTNSLPIVSILSSTNTVCAFSNASLTASGASTYTWSNNFTGSATVVNPSTNTTYTVTGTDALGCSSIATVAIATNSLPIISISPSLTTVCSLENTTLTVSGADTYSWGTGSTNTSVVVNPSVTTSYSVSGTNSLGCVGISNAVVVTNTLPIIGITASSPTNCANSAVSFTANGGTTYTWSTGTNGATISVTPSTTSVYSVSGTDPNNSCVGAQTISVNTFSLPIVTVASSAASVCPGNSATLTASGAQTYSWINTSLPGLTSVVTPTASTAYSVIGTDAIGCASMGSLTVGLFNLPNISVSPANQTICVNEVASFTASGGTTYTWTPSNTNSNTFTVSPSIISFYTVSGTDANACTNFTTFLVSVSKCTGIDANSISSSVINVFPNPSQGFVTAEFDFDGTKEITVVNAIGELILAIQTENHQASFDLSSYAKGIYYIRIKSNNTSSNYRVIIE